MHPADERNLVQFARDNPRLYARWAERVPPCYWIVSRFWAGGQVVSIGSLDGSKYAVRHDQIVHVGPTWDECYRALDEGQLQI